MPNSFAQRFVAIGASNSTTTSPPYWVGDANTLSLSIQSSTASSSRYTIQGSNDDGFGAPLDAAAWSLVTAIVDPVSMPAIFTISAGARWLRAWVNPVSINDPAGSTASGVTIIFAQNTL